MKLNLGACDRPFPGFSSIDIVEPADRIVDLEGPWPWPMNSVDEVLAHDVIEHIGDCDHISETYRCYRCGCGAQDARYDGREMRHPLGRIHFMNELYRVLKPGCFATIETPNASRGAGFFQDPTHKTPWCMNSFQYFTLDAFANTRFNKSYGITAAFKVVSLSERPYQDVCEEVWKITAVLQKPVTPY